MAKDEERPKGRVVVFEMSRRLSLDKPGRRAADLSASRFDGERQKTAAPPTRQPPLLFTALFASDFFMQPRFHFCRPIVRFAEPADISRFFAKSINSTEQTVEKIDEIASIGSARITCTSKKVILCLDFLCNYLFCIRFEASKTRLLA